MLNKKVKCFTCTRTSKVISSGHVGTDSNLSLSFPRKAKQKLRYIENTFCLLFQQLIITYIMLNNLTPNFALTKQLHIYFATIF